MPSPTSYLLRTISVTEMPLVLAQLKRHAIVSMKRCFTAPTVDDPGRAINKGGCAPSPPKRLHWKRSSSETHKMFPSIFKNRGSGTHNRSGKHKVKTLVQILYATLCEEDILRETKLQFNAKMQKKTRTWITHTNRSHAGSIQTSKSNNRRDGKEVHGFGYSHAHRSGAGHWNTTLD